MLVSYTVKPGYMQPGYMQDPAICSSWLVTDFFPYVLHCMRTRLYAARLYAGPGYMQPLAGSHCLLLHYSEPASLHPGSLHDPYYCSFWLTPIVYFCTIRNPHLCTTRIIAAFDRFPRSCNDAGSTVYQ